MDIGCPPVCQVLAGLEIAENTALEKADRDPFLGELTFPLEETDDK